MNAIGEGAPVLVVRRRIAVRRERVFAAWLDSESLARWMRPGDCTTATVTVDTRVGGGFRIVMHNPTHGGIEHHGRYLAIEPPSFLSFTWISGPTEHRETVVSIEFEERGSETELILTHRGLPAKAVEGHRKGWTDALRLLDEAMTRAG